MGRAAAVVAWAVAVVVVPTLVVPALVAMFGTGWVVSPEPAEKRPVLVEPLPCRRLWGFPGRKGLTLPPIWFGVKAMVLLRVLASSWETVLVECDAVEDILLLMSWAGS